jgi:hypothetical protein
MKEIPIGFGPCVFCGKDIAETNTDPCSVNVSTKSGAWQVWKCHGDCYKSRITKDSPMDLSPAHF